MLHVKHGYGTDPSGAGFFCPQMEQKKLDYFALKILRPAEAEAVYQCRPGAKIGSIFVEADFRYYEAPIGLSGGISDPAVAQLVERTGMLIAQGWDTAMSASSTADWTVCVTIGMVPCEHFHRDKDAMVLKICDQHYDVYVLNVFRDKLDIGDLTLAIRAQAIMWNPQKIVIEAKQSGTSAIQALMNFGLPIEGVKVEENKLQRAVNGGAGAGSTQGWFRSGRVLFPRLPGMPLDAIPWMPPLVRELKDFTGEKGGVDDQVDALVHVVNYAIREGTAGVQFPEGWQTADQANAQMHTMNAMYGGTQLGGMGALSAMDPSVLLADGMVTDPSDETCGKCANFRKGERPTCRLYKFSPPALSPACPSYDGGGSFESFPLH